MLKDRKKILLASLLAFMCLGINAQSNLGSTPYSRYGYGKEVPQTVGRNRGMGGIGIGLRSNQQTNSMNPASYTAIDSLTFLFDFGLNLMLEEFSENDAKQHKWNGGFDYVNIQVPLSKKVAMAMGYLPYTFVGYEYGTEGETVDPTGADPVAYVERYSGSGGLNKVYLGLGYKPFSWMSLGINGGFVYGTIQNDQYTGFLSTVAENALISNSMSARGFDTELGVQFMKNFGEKHNVVLGAIWAPKTKLRVSTDYLNTLGGDTVKHIAQDYHLHLPEKYGVGVTYIYDRRLTLGVDYKKEKWGSVSSMSYDLQEVDGDLRDRNLLAFGAEYLPALMTRDYLKRIRYRAGFYLSDSYTQVAGSKNKEFGVTVGFGFPLRNQKTMINAAFEYNRVKPENSTLLSENYYMLTLGLTFNEMWFFKNKLK